jgi:hypothetical protein
MRVLQNPVRHGIVRRDMAAARDLVTMLYSPRETMRRILADPQHRWWIQIVILALVCMSFGDPDIRRMPREVPDLALGPLLATIVLVVIATALCWVLLVYLGSWLVTLAGRILEGRAAVRDVRAALAWAFVPMIWSLAYRIPFAIYRSRIHISGTSGWQITLDLLEQGTLSMALLIVAIKLIFTVWVVCLASLNVAEAMKFEAWKGFAAIAMVGALPLVIAAAAVLASHV